MLFFIKISQENAMVFSPIVVHEIYILTFSAVCGKLNEIIKIKEK
jgi:hypothetical protein